MNSIIVSETCTAPTAPIQVPLTQLSPLSQTCLSCPNSVHPPPPTPILLLLFPLQTLLSPKALPVHQPETPALYFSIPLAVRRWDSVLFLLACGGVGEVSITAPPRLRRGHFGDGAAGETRRNSVGWGLNLAMALC